MKKKKVVLYYMRQLILEKMDTKLLSTIIISKSKEVGVNVTIANINSDSIYFKIPKSVPLAKLELPICKALVELLKDKNTLKTILKECKINNKKDLVDILKTEDNLQSVCEIDYSTETLSKKKIFYIDFEQ